MRTLPDECVDLTVTSPPYDNLRKYNGFSFDFEAVAKELYRITKPGGVVVWVVGDATVNGSETGTSFRQALFFKDIGFNLHDTMIYDKGACQYPSFNRYYQSFEYMFVFSKGKVKTFNPIQDRKNVQSGKKISGKERQRNSSLHERSGTRNGRTIKEYGFRYNVWKISPGYGKSSLDKYAYEHPAIFPEQLAGDHIVSWSNKGDVVFDPFLGSGTTGKMAVLNERNFIGFELDPTYFEICKRRINDTLAVMGESHD